jgi:hypothetical protein
VFVPGLIGGRSAGFGLLDCAFAEPIMPSWAAAIIVDLFFYFFGHDYLPPIGFKGVAKSPFGSGERLQMRQDLARHFIRRLARRKVSDSVEHHTPIAAGEVTVLTI